MDTVISLFNKAVDFLSLHGVDNPKRDAEVILGHLMNKGLVALIDPHMSVSAADVEMFWKMIEQRSVNVPISHIIGRREFWSTDFIVNSNVLDPRSDSETIISTVFTMYPYKNRRLIIGDFGTGSGCLLTILLLKYKNAIGIAVEKSVKAYRVAYQNFKKHGVYNRIKMKLSSWDNCYEMFDLIVSNPPYIRRNKIAKLQPEIVLYEPCVALDGGPVGMESYRQIFVVVKRCLRDGGVAVLEIGEDQSQIHAMVSQYGLKFHSYHNDLSGTRRCIVVKQV